MKSRFNVNRMVQTSLMIALALVFQIGFAPFAQTAVGPLVNMVLLVSAALISPLSGVVVGIITPLMAFIVGIMPLLPLVPIIMIGNSILVVTFGYCYHQSWMKYGEYYGLIVAALFKFLFLTTAVQHILPLFLAKVPGPIITAMGFNQFITAIIGGIVALIIITGLKHYYKGKNRN